MDFARGRCARPQSNWLMYFIAITLLSSLYIYIQVIHNGENVRKFQKDLISLKKDVQSMNNRLFTAEYKLTGVDNILQKMKTDREKYRNQIKTIISKEVEKFGSDKTGRTDFALESTGGKIVQLSPGTENLEKANTLFGIPLCEGMHSPRSMIQAGMSPGHCWAMKGSSGGAIIKLLGKVKIDAVTLEHISKQISPTAEISSAPKDFSVWGMKEPTGRGQFLGEFKYDINGPLLQTFSITNPNYFEYLEFRVMTNQGNPSFTCIYRFRVHGTLEKGSV